MSDIQARIAEVLAGHVRDDNLAKSTRMYCSCRKWVSEHPRYGLGRGEHYAHIAAMLAPLIREAQREAWGEGFDRAHSQHAEFDLLLSRRTQAIASDNPYEEREQDE